VKFKRRILYFAHFGRSSKLYHAANSREMPEPEEIIGRKITQPYPPRCRRRALEGGGGGWDRVPSRVKARISLTFDKLGNLYQPRESCSQERE
jgi:hypothetical protein